MKMPRPSQGPERKLAAGSGEHTNQQDELIQCIKKRKKERKLKEDMQREYMQKAQPHRSQHASGAFGPGADLSAYGKFRSGPSEGGGASEDLHAAWGANAICGFLAAFGA